MKKTKILTTINLCISAFACLLFIFNQLCNLRFLGLWVAWILSGYAFALLVGPISVVFSCISTAITCISTAISCDTQKDSPKRVKYIVTNIICTVIIGLLLLSCFMIRGTLTWA